MIGMVVVVMAEGVVVVVVGIRRVATVVGRMSLVENKKGVELVAVEVTSALVAAAAVVTELWVARMRWHSSATMVCVDQQMDATEGEPICLARRS